MGYQMDDGKYAQVSEREVNRFVFNEKVVLPWNTIENLNKKAPYPTYILLKGHYGIELGS